jgi:hypothetical protein
MLKTIPTDQLPTAFIARPYLLAQPSDLGFQTCSQGSKTWHLCTEEGWYDLEFSQSICPTSASGGQRPFGGSISNVSHHTWGLTYWGSDFSHHISGTFWNFHWLSVSLFPFAVFVSNPDHRATLGFHGLPFSRCSALVRPSQTSWSQGPPAPTIQPGYRPGGEILHGGPGFLRHPRGQIARAPQSTPMTGNLKPNNIMTRYDNLMTTFTMKWNSFIDWRSPTINDIRSVRLMAWTRTHAECLAKSSQCLQEIRRQYSPTADLQWWRRSFEKHIKNNKPFKKNQYHGIGSCLNPLGFTQRWISLKLGYSLGLSLGLETTSTSFPKQIQSSFGHFLAPGCSGPMARAANGTAWHAGVTDSLWCFYGSEW